MFGQIGRFQAGQDSLLVDYLTQRNVGTNRVVQHHHILAHHGKLGSQCLQWPIGNVDATEFDSTLGRQHKLGQQIHQGGFART